jgi:PPOX class probable F420-dependent enzyme
VDLTEREARARLAAARVARLATADTSGQPHLVPVTFAFDSAHDAIVIAVDHKPKRSTDLRRLRNVRANPRVAVLADHYEDDWTRLWWVRADGVAAIIEDAGGRAGPVALLQAKYPQYRSIVPAGPVIAITIAAVRGWSYA